MTTDPDPPIESSESILAELDEFNRNVAGWQFAAGPVYVRGAFSSMRLARYFIVFHLLVWVVGGVLILTDGPARELGMALVVGALFGFGAFVSQVWTLQVQKERGDANQARRSELLDRLNRALEAEAQRRRGH